MPTEACNFRCFYCYESFARGKMRPALVAAVKKLLSREAPTLERLRLAWFGGEPLLALDAIEEIGAHALALAAAHPRLSLASEISTNGWLLTPAVFERLCALGVGHYQIAFDGPPERHDRLRRRRAGGATFERLWDHLRGMRRSPREFRAVVRLHLDSRGLADAERFIDLFHAGFGGDPRFTIFLRPLSRFGGPNDDRLAVLSPAAARAASSRLARRCEALGLACRTVACDPVCYASQPRSFLVRSNGRLGKCTIAIDDPANDVGSLELDGALRLDMDRLKPWLSGTLSGDQDELACPRAHSVGSGPGRFGARR